MSAVRCVLLTHYTWWWKANARTFSASLISRLFRIFLAECVGFGVTRTVELNGHFNWEQFFWEVLFGVCGLMIVVVAERMETVAKCHAEQKLESIYFENWLNVCFQFKRDLARHFLIKNKLIRDLLTSREIPSLRINHLWLMECALNLCALYIAYQTEKVSKFRLEFAYK